MVWWFDSNRGKFTEMEKEAYRQVEAIFADERIFVLFHLTIKPSFTNPAGYTMFYRLPTAENRRAFQPDIPVIHSVRRVIWDKVHDIQRAQSVDPWLFTFSPSMKTDEIELSARHFTDMLERVQHIAIPLVGVEARLGRDGCIYEIFKRDDCSFHLRWWEQGPPQWRELTQWVDEFIKAVDVAIDGA